MNPVDTSMLSYSLNPPNFTEVKNKIHIHSRSMAATDHGKVQDDEKVHIVRDSSHQASKRETRLEASRT